MKFKYMQQRYITFNVQQVLFTFYKFNKFTCIIVNIQNIIYIAC